MKIFTVDKIREADKFTIENESISSADLMERAASRIADFVKERTNKEVPFFIFSGPGNNGGDGLVIARLLSEAGYTVKLVIINASDKFSDNFLLNRTRLLNNGAVHIEEWTKEPLPEPHITSEAYIIDALLGSGLSKPLNGLIAKVVKWINTLPNIIISIDIATGLFANQPNDYIKDSIVKPDYTLSFQFPKLCFMMPENDAYVGDWHLMDIALSPEYIQKTDSPYALIQSADVSIVLKHRPKFMHKGMAGHLLMIAGSAHKMGAALLSAKAALKTGCGLLTLHHPKDMHLSLVSALPEMMSDEDEHNAFFSQLPGDLQKYQALAIGPGLGTAPQTAKAFKLLLQEWRAPMLIDADAINILAENPTYLHFLPPNSILTPHIGELHRLIGVCANAYERLEKTTLFAQKYQVIVLLKGAYSAIVMPNTKIYFNSTGNAGMATAGSGDVLSGIIASLLAQGYDTKAAAILGCYLHGRAGDIVAHQSTMHSLIASDIVDHISEAYKTLC